MSDLTGIIPADLMDKILAGEVNVEKTSLCRSVVCRKLVDAGIIPKTFIKDFKPTSKRRFNLPNGSVMIRQSYMSGVWIIIGPQAKKDKQWLRGTNHRRYEPPEPSWSRGW